MLYYVNVQPGQNEKRDSFLSLPAEVVLTKSKEESIKGRARRHKMGSTLPVFDANT